MRASYKQKQPGAQQSHGRDLSLMSQKPVIPQLKHRSSTVTIYNILANPKCFFLQEI
jgi:hypothetical protein